MTIDVILCFHWFVFVWWSAVDFKAGDQIFKMFSTSELEKPDQGVETKSVLGWTAQRQACRRKVVCISLYDVCINSQCCFPCLPEAASCNELPANAVFSSRISEVCQIPVEVLKCLFSSCHSSILAWSCAPWKRCLDSKREEEKPQEQSRVTSKLPSL